MKVAMLAFRSSSRFSSLSSALSVAEDKLLKRLDDLNANIATFIGLLQGGFEGTISNVPFVIRGIKPPVEFS